MVTAAAAVTWGRSALVAEVYDLDKPIGRSYGDIEYYVALLAGRPGRVLDLATGTGRLLVPLLQAGVDVDGLDHSADMLTICGRNCRDRALAPVLHEADMADFRLPHRYAAVIIPAGSIRNLGSVERTRTALAACHRALLPGGLLAVDLAPPRRVPAPKSMRCWWRGALLWTLHTVHAQYDPAIDRTTEFLRYERWRDARLETTEMHPFLLQHWELPAFTALLRETGFADVSVFGDFQVGRAPSAEDTDWTVTATRR